MKLMTLILCADDYGQSQAISQAIIQLLAAGRLSATSCLVTSALWPAHASGLQPYIDKADIGLHFNLTDGVPLSAQLQFMPLGQLLLRACTRQLSQAAIEAELHAQLDAFTAQLGRLPDHIDGHQHIHQLPVIRDALLAVYARRLAGRNIYIRSLRGVWPWLPPKQGGWLKQWVLQTCGGRALAARLRAQHIPHNQAFSGVYDFPHAQDYPVFCKHFLRELAQQGGGLMLCHPGLEDGAAADPLVHSRPLELAYLAGDDFVAELKAVGLRLGRFNSA